MGKETVEGREPVGVGVCGGRVKDWMGKPGRLDDVRLGGFFFEMTGMAFVTVMKKYEYKKVGRVGFSFFFFNESKSVDHEFYIFLRKNSHLFIHRETTLWITSFLFFFFLRENSHH